eukprot:TRINITY_DN17722_c0_g1_i2.p1 TRINITY_DN17722_c0_g1~~TRINITY_DN17722_c0_g1_i2.p1  ORF type:complete len:373 (-),score=66.92 TRINITY_DN17722_c0_g1_i2:35-1153(-)
MCIRDRYMGSGYFELKMQESKLVTMAEKLGQGQNRVLFERSHTTGELEDVKVVSTSVPVSDKSDCSLDVSTLSVDRRAYRRCSTTEEGSNTSLDFDRYFQMTSVSKMYCAATPFDLDDLRFCLLSHRGKLFENDILQVGFVSSFKDDDPLHVQVKFFYRNKCPSKLTKFSCLLQNEKGVPSESVLEETTLQPGQQYQQSVLVFRGDQRPFSIPIIALKMNSGDSALEYYLPIPVSLNKYIQFSFEDIESLRNSWKQSKRNRIVGNWRPMNRKLVRSKADFFRHFPAMKDAGVCGISKRERILGRFRLFGGNGSWFNICIILRMNRMVSFQVAQEQSDPYYSTLILDTFNFIFTDNPQPVSYTHLTLPTIYSV